MASLRKKPRSPYWWACFTDVGGKRLQRSTGVLITGKAKSRTDALRIAGEYEEAARRRRTARQVREVIEELHHRITGQELPSITLSKFVKQWLSSKEHGTATATQVFYKSCTEKFTTFLGEDAELNLADITQGHIDRFKNHELSELKLSARTVNHDVKCVKMLFKAARRGGFLTDDPSEFVETVKDRSQGKTRHPFTIDQVRAIVSVADDEWKSMILCGIFTGQRLGDIARLNWSNVDLERREVRLTTQKTGKVLVLPMAEQFFDHLANMPSCDQPHAPLHPRAWGIVEKQGKTGALSNQFVSLLAQAGLREKKAHRKTHGNGRGMGRDESGLSFHSLRHTANSMLKEAGIPDAVVQAFIGHDDRDISDHYTHVGRTALQGAANAFPKVT